MGSLSKLAMIITITENIMDTNELDNNLMSTKMFYNLISNQVLTDKQIFIT